MFNWVNCNKTMHYSFSQKELLKKKSCCFYLKETRSINLTKLHFTFLIFAWNQYKRACVCVCQITVYRYRCPLSSKKSSCRLAPNAVKNRKHASVQLTWQICSELSFLTAYYQCRNTQEREKKAVMVQLKYCPRTVSNFMINVCHIWYIIVDCL